MIEFDPVLVHDWLSRSARRFPQKTALICGSERWTYHSLNYHTHKLAQGLLSMGMQRQDRVLIFLDNSSETVISLYSVLKASGVFVIVDGGVKSSRLKHVAANSGARLIITHTNKAGVVMDSLESLGDDFKIVWVGPEENIPASLSDISVSWNSILGDCNTESQCNTDMPITGDLPRTIDIDIATLIYTSATTGAPKGIISTHHNMISAARSIVQYVDNDPDDIILNVLPLSFDYGLYQVIMAFMFGGTIVLERSFLFLHQILQRIEQEKVTGFPIVPTIVAMLLKATNLERYDFSTLRYMTNTGAALPEKHIRTLRELFPWVRIFSMFGLTECKRVSYLSPEYIDIKPSSVGQAMPNCEVYVVDSDGKEAPRGQTGELVIRGANVMQGYWNDPDTTGRTYHTGRYPADRILHSGDYFRQDEEGFLYFVGRKDSMIKSGGERISPKEIENLICEREGVSEVAVIGLPDDILGQAIKAFIVTDQGVEITEQDVLRHCKDKMEMRMVPRYIQMVESLPRTNNGKIDRKQLQAQEVQRT